jgi:hypothetical protein
MRSAALVILVLMLRQVSPRNIIYNLFNPTNAAAPLGFRPRLARVTAVRRYFTRVKLQSGSVIFFGLRAVLALKVVDLTMLLARSRRFH